MNTLLLSLLRFLARHIIAKHKPYLIGVTGTIGKTTVTTYIASYLRLVYGDSAVGISPYHYNGEYGLPLTIMGAKTGGKNPFLWLLAFAKGLITYFRSYPRYLILEYGIDHPGEMEYLLSIVRPDIAILTPVAPNHLEQFGSLELYRSAKLLLPQSAKSYAIVHESLREYIARDNIFFYGKENNSDASLISAEQNIEGINAQVLYDKKNFNITLPSFGTYQVENILPLYLLSGLLKIDENLIEKNTSLFAPDIGRSRLLEGKGNTTIIDGSYNGGFEAICRGLDSIASFADTHRIICLLGDMRELGEHSESIHTELAKYILEIFRGREKNISLYLVGPLMKEYVSPRVSESISTTCSLSSRSLGEKIRLVLSSDDTSTIVYVKGSQNTIFLEEGIKEFLRNPKDIALLCRQPKDWMKKKEEYFRKNIVT